MTRINCVPPQELTTKHLVAEYRELPRVFKLARRLKEGEAPKNYTLGTGHVKFFYDKLLYCYIRQHQLVFEMLNRGYHPKFDPADLKQYRSDDTLWCNWEPDDKAIEINRARINERLNGAK